MRQRHSYWRLFCLRMPKLSIFLCFAALLALAFAQEQETFDTTFSSENFDDVPVLVDDYLDKLSDTDLRQICADRGFDIVPSNGLEESSVVTRQDLLDGARRCLTLEDEMNAILAEHPELAAELDKEIERMRKQKELLEREREEILVQKTLLERQLQNAGVDIGPTQAVPASDPSGSKAVAQSTKNPAVPDTLEGVLKQSFKELYERVMQDFRLVQKILHPVTQQLERICQFIWRYTKPVLGSVYSKARSQLEEFQSQRRQQTLPANDQ